jgi:NADPH2:quinone reductase
MSKLARRKPAPAGIAKPGNAQAATTHGFRVHQAGGIEQLRWEQWPLLPPARGEVLVRHTAIGVNYIDTYVRSGLYPRALPTGLGSEAAGVVEAVGPGVNGMRPGDRVAYCLGEPGAYAERRVLPAASLLRLPPRLSAELAAAALLKGLTAWALLHEVRRVRRGDALLVTAAAGGVGLILCQWARLLGARVIGVVGHRDKQALARRHGCHVVLVGYQDLAERVRGANRGLGVDVVYDGVGRDTFMAALDCLRARGLMTSFGNASGPPPALAPLELMKRGSLLLTRPTLGDFIGDPLARARGARALFSLLRTGKLRVLVGQRYPLQEAPRAHAELEARRTVGCSLLIP